MTTKNAEWKMDASQLKRSSERSESLQQVMIGLHNLLHPPIAPQMQSVPVKPSSKMKKSNQVQREIVRVDASGRSGCSRIKMSASSPNDKRSTSRPIMQQYPNCEDKIILVNTQPDIREDRAKPVIGRRLPTKSTGASGLMGQPRGYTAMVQQEMANVAARANAEYLNSGLDKAPVVGRRSHRLQQMQITRPTIVYQFGGSFDGKDYTSRQQQQPLNIIETHTGHVSAQQAKKSIKPKAKVVGGRKKQSVAGPKFQSLSIMNIAEQLASIENNRSRDHDIRGLLKCNSNCCLPAASGDKIHRMHYNIPNAARHQALNRVGSLSSSSSSPLYLQSSQELCPGCEPGANFTVAYQSESCCAFESSSPYDGCGPNSGRRVPSCCAMSSQHLDPMLYNNHSPIPNNATTNIENPEHNNQTHHSCQANEVMGHVHSSRTGSAYRSSSCQRERQQQPPMLLIGRNVLPVHPKPKLNNTVLDSRQPIKLQITQCGIAQAKKSRIRAPRGNADTSEEMHSPAVNQMYESLAAELKAKLGDPKIGPILLPPKDYDTISRKQGKLTGIELRRSTNPQLVGPTANNRSHMTSETTDSKPPVEKADDVAIGSSIRSSGRSQDDMSLGHRSRSNSSSGLGSISMGAGSPNSSPSSKSSSSEDMRPNLCLGSKIVLDRAPVDSSKILNPSLKLNYDSATRRSEVTMAQQKLDYDAASHTSSINNRKNSSPDNFGSDSGHSDGSGNLDSSPQESDGQKISDKFYKPNLAMNKFRTHVNVNSNKLVGENLMQSRQDDATESAESIEQPQTNKNFRSRCWGVEIPLKVNSDKNNGVTYLATKQIIY